MSEHSEGPQGAATLEHWRLSRDLDEVAWLTIDQTGERANTLGTAVIAELESMVDALERDPPRALVLASAKAGSFISGADIREFDATTDVGELRAQIERVHALFDRFSKLPFPTVAAIDGACLGGGLELALCCDWRVAFDAEHTRLGFPEVNLGIYPGFGGTGRSIHAIGALQAMPLMLAGRMLSAKRARGAGLVDAVTNQHGSLRWSARLAALAGRRHRRPGVIKRLATLAPVRKVLATQMRKRTEQQAPRRHYPAPHRLIDAFAAHGGSSARMIKAEAQNVPDLLVGEISTNLRRVYRLMQRLQDEGRRSDFSARRVHVIGAGTMGGDIAAWCVSRGLEVTLQDREMKYIEPALKRAEGFFRKRLKDPTAVAAARARLRADPDGSGVARADVVIEAIFEQRGAKRELFEKLAGQLAPHTLVATNTSAIPLGELSDTLDDPSRMIGLHFFNPVASMPLVEVVHAPDTDPARVADGASFVASIGKYALPVTSTPGFLVNRVLVPYMRKAMAMKRDGIPQEALDAAAVDFGMPMGPVELVDTVGLDVALGVINTLLGDEAGEDRRTLEQMVEAGKLGKKSGTGFYTWKGGKPRRDRYAVDGHDLEALANQLVAPYLAECQACLDDGVVADAELLDAGMIFGTGFAPFRGGPLHYRATLDSDQNGGEA